jgi:hypothetical protein
MPTLNRDPVYFSGRHPYPELDVPQEALPEKLQILLCLMEGAERRRLLQAKIHSLPGQRSGRGEFNVPYRPSGYVFGSREEGQN